MGKSRELDPHNLGIFAIFQDRRDIQVSIMPGQPMVEVLRESLKPDAPQEYMQDGTLLFVADMKGGKLRMVSGVQEQGDTRGRLTYGVFTPEGQLLPDPYACATIIGRYDRVQEIRHQIVDSLA